MPRLLDALCALWALRVRPCDQRRKYKSQVVENSLDKSSRPYYKSQLLPEPFFKGLLKELLTHIFVAYLPKLYYCIYPCYHINKMTKS